MSRKHYQSSNLRMSKKFTIQSCYAVHMQKPVFYSYETINLQSTHLFCYIVFQNSYKTVLIKPLTTNVIISQPQNRGQQKKRNHLLHLDDLSS